MAEEKIKLSLDYGESKKDTIDVAGALDKVKTAASAVGNEAFAELIGKSKEMVEKLKETADAAKEGGEKTKLGLADIGEAASGLFSAFKEGNVGAAIKGVSGIVALVPALNTFAPAIKLAGDMADTAWPLLKEWYEYLGKANEKIVESTKDINEYAKALRDSDAALKDSDELAKARAADKEAAAEIPKKAQQRGEIFSDLTKGNQEGTLKEVFDAVHKDREDERDDEVEAIKKKYAGYRKEALARNPNAESGALGQAMKLDRDRKEQAEIAKVQSGEKDQKVAEELLTKARAGDAAAIKKLREILPDGSVTGEVARMASPEAQDEAREGKRDVADQQTRFAARQKQKAEKDAAMQKVQDRIKADIAAKNAGMITDLENRARGQAVKDAEKAAGQAMGRGGASLQGAAAGRPDRFTNDASRRGTFNRLRKASEARAKREAQKVRDVRAREHKIQTQKAQEDADEGRTPQPEVIRPMWEILRASLQDTGAQNAQINGLIQQLRMAQASNRAGIVSNRSQASNGTI